MEVEAIDCGLHARFWSLRADPTERTRHLLLVTDGTGEAETQEHRTQLAAPGLAWIGRTESGRLRMEAGATGMRARIGDALLVEAIGDSLDSVLLRQLIDRDFSLSLAGHGELTGTITRCLEAAMRERRQPQAGTPLILSALLRILLVGLLRVSGGEMEAPAAGARIGVLQRFRQLVEMNFRHHWPVARYAATLGVSADRLHAICTQGVGKSPKALISERLATEAMLRLERSSLTVQELGNSLGFTDPAHFSSFFRRMTGTPPGRYRQAVVEARRGHSAPPAPSFAEWP